MINKHHVLPVAAFFQKAMLVLCMLLTGFYAYAQFRLTVKVTGIPAAQSGEAVYLAGSFNQWNPADTAFRLVKAGDTYQLALNNLPAALHEFKFTRGGWNKVECDTKGIDISNRQVDLKSDTVIYCTIQEWVDDFTSVTKHTSSDNIHLLDSAFFIPQLNRYRKIWIYLPSGYDHGRRHYPVLYMHDGQNLFDEALAPYGEWGIDECLDTMIAAGAAPCIVVGIANGGVKRMNEYNPFEFVWKNDTAARRFDPEGEQYLAFITQTLKPYIDKHYRTLTGKENTIIAGSSMGGLISYYATLRYPGVFGKAGVFSPAFWTASGIDSVTESTAAKMSAKYFFYLGGKEGYSFAEDMKLIMDKLAVGSSAQIYSVIDSAAEHNEKAWRKWFPEFYRFIMADGFNVITTPAP